MYVGMYELNTNNTFVIFIKSDCSKVNFEVHNNTFAIAADF